MAGAEHQPERSRHVASLDGVRGIAVVLVMLLHYEVRRFQLHFPGAGLVRKGVEFGWAGVDLFFVLSGFLITGILWDAKERPDYYRNFFARRALRIFPLLSAFLLLVFVVLPALGAAPATPGGTQVWYWTYTNNFLVALKGWGAAAPFTPHLWSLAVEEQFYLVWPFVMLSVSRRTGMALCAGLAALALACRIWVAGAHGNVTANFVLTPTRMDTLAVGAFLALAVRGPGGITGVLRSWRPAGLVAAALFAGLVQWRGAPSQNDRVIATVGFTLVALVWGWLVAEAFGAAEGGLPARALGNRPLVWVGRRSYAIYVLHHPILTALSARGFDVAAIEAKVGSPALAHLAFVATNFAVTALAAQVSWVVLERRCLQLKERFGPAASWSRRPAHTAETARVSATGMGFAPPFAAEE
jgi:peptidoglycan/LPS O-acetylase OafA/YrhL